MDRRRNFHIRLGGNADADDDYVMLGHVPFPREIKIRVRQASGDEEKHYNETADSEEREDRVDIGNYIFPTSVRTSSGRLVYQDSHDARGDDVGSYSSVAERVRAWTTRLVFHRTPEMSADDYYENPDLDDGEDEDVASMGRSPTSVVNSDEGVNSMGISSNSMGNSNDGEDESVSDMVRSPTSVVNSDEGVNSMGRSPNRMGNSGESEDESVYDMERSPTSVVNLDEGVGSMGILSNRMGNPGDSEDKGVSGMDRSPNRMGNSGDGEHEGGNSMGRSPTSVVNLDEGVNSMGTLPNSMGNSDDDEDEGLNSLGRSPSGEAKTADPLRGTKRKATDSMEGAGSSKRAAHTVPDCPVCQLSMEEKRIVVTECGHLICHDCMQTILGGGYARKCPKCRKSIKLNTVRDVYF